MVDNRMSHVFKTLIVFMWFLMMHDNAFSSDQADYSAPYITFEDGKLVTKDPTKDSVNIPLNTHTAETGENMKSVQSSSMESGESAISDVENVEQSAESASTSNPVIISVALSLVFAGFIAYKVKSGKD